MTITIKSLRIDGEDVDDLLEEIAQALDIRFGDRELQHVTTMGELHEAVMRRLDGRFQNHQRCATAMAFYRLRRALGEHVTPATPLAGLVQGPLRRWIKDLSSRSGLRIPHAQAERITGAGCLVLVAAGVALILAGLHEVYLLAFAALAPLGVALFRLDPLHLPSRWATVGDFARVVARYNYGALAVGGARMRGPEIWDVLREIAAALCNLDFDAIGRDTKILAPSWRDVLAA